MADTNWRARQSRQDLAQALIRLCLKGAGGLGITAIFLAGAAITLPPVFSLPASEFAWMWQLVVLSLAGALVLFVVSLVPVKGPVKIPEEELQRRRERALQAEVEADEVRKAARRFDEARRIEWERTPGGRLALAQSTDTPKANLRKLALEDPVPEVRRAAVETLALLNQAGL